MATKQSEADLYLDAVIVGAGFSGMYMLHRLRGLGLNARIFEAGSGVGGTWYWNRYPGARVDIESLEYGYSFDEALENEWRWSERYASQPELLRYLNHVADRYDLRRDIKLETRVTAAVYNETENRWDVTTDHGAHISARFCIMATGCLSTPKPIDFEGIDEFSGKIYKTFAWPQEGVDFTGQRVAVIGTGSSAIQSIPIIAKQAAHLHVFQRTPNYSVPAHNHRMPAELQADWDENRKKYRAEARSEGLAAIIKSNDTLTLDVSAEQRQSEFEARWDIGGFRILGSFADLAVDAKANDEAAAFVATKIRETVKDPVVADMLTPKTYPFSTKRLCIDSGYYETYNRDNVTLVDLHQTPIERLTAQGVKTSGAVYEFDSIVFATGFDAMTGTLTRIDIRGREGIKLVEKWSAGPQTYLGLMVSGFPNLFTITGPGSPSVLTNMIMSIEQHVEWISDCIAYLETHALGIIEASPEAEGAWGAHVNDVADSTLYPQANSWYMGVNVPGKPRMFMPYVGGFPAYVEACNAIVANGYEGFILKSAPH
jgi:cyclohexanone monooxygenase